MKCYSLAWSRLYINTKFCCNRTLTTNRYTGSLDLMDPMKMNETISRKTYSILDGHIWASEQFTIRYRSDKWLLLCWIMNETKWNEDHVSHTHRFLAMALRGCMRVSSNCNKQRLKDSWARTYAAIQVWIVNWTLENVCTKI